MIINNFPFCFSSCQYSNRRNIGLEVKNLFDESSIILIAKPEKKKTTDHIFHKYRCKQKTKNPTNLSKWNPAIYTIDNNHTKLRFVEGMKNWFKIQKSI